MKASRLKFMLYNIKCIKSPLTLPTDGGRSVNVTTHAYQIKPHGHPNKPIIKIETTIEIRIVLRNASISI